MNVERAEDVLMHKRLLHLAHDPANRPSIEVHLVQVTWFLILTYVAVFFMLLIQIFAVFYFLVISCGVTLLFLCVLLLTDRLPSFRSGSFHYWRRINI